MHTTLEQFANCEITIDKITKTYTEHLKVMTSITLELKQGLRINVLISQ